MDFIPFDPSFNKFLLNGCAKKAFKTLNKPNPANAVAPPPRLTPVVPNIAAGVRPCADLSNPDLKIKVLTSGNASGKLLSIFKKS